MPSTFQIEPLAAAVAVGQEVTGGNGTLRAAFRSLDRQRFSRAKVTIGGAGNIGSPLARMLAQAGVGVIRIVDRDRVEEKNVANQDYLPGEVGCFKAEALADRLGRQFTGQRFEAIVADIEDVPLGDFMVDAICVALDSRRGRQRMLSEIAWPMNVPAVDGGVGEGGLGRVQVFVPGPDTACLECGWTRADYVHLAAEYPCIPGASAQARPTAVPAIVGSVVASLMTAECVRLIEGPMPETSHEIAFDLAHRRFLSSRLRRSKSCRFDHKIVHHVARVAFGFPGATWADLLNNVQNVLGSDVFQCELPRRVAAAPSDIFDSRFVPAVELETQAGRSLESVGLTRRDWLRVWLRDGRSAFVTAGEQPDMQKPEDSDVD